MMENFLKSLNVFLFTNKSLLLTPRLGIICVQETRLSFLQHAADPLSHLFRLPPWGPALTNRLAQVESGSESCFCSPGPMGSFPPGPGWDFSAFVCSGLWGLPESLRTSPQTLLYCTDGALAHHLLLTKAEETLISFSVPWNISFFIVRLKISLSKYAHFHHDLPGNASVAAGPRGSQNLAGLLFKIIELLVFFYVTRQGLAHSKSLLCFSGMRKLRILFFFNFIPFSNMFLRIH